MRTPDAALKEPEVHDLRQVLRPFLRLLRPFAGRFACGAGLILLSTGVEIALPWVLGRVVDAAALGNPGLGTLYRFCSLYAGLILFRAIVDSAQGFVIQSTGQAVTHVLRCRLFEKLESLPVAFFDRQPTGRLVTRVINDIKSLSDLFTASISVLALDLLIIAATVVAMLYMNARLTLAVLATFPLALLAIHFFGVKLAAAYREVRARLAEINAFLGENVGAIAAIQRLAAEEQRLSRFTGIVEEHQRSQLRTVGVFALVQPVTNLLNGIALATLLGVGGLWVIEGKLSVGLLAAFLGYIKNLFQPIRDMIEKYNMFLSARVAAERVSGLLSQTSEWTPVAPSGPVSRDRDATIRFDGVTFRYPGSERAALERVSFEVPHGTSLAVVGATGSGKSTLIRLLLRFYDVTEGGIQVGGTPLEQWDRGTLRRFVGVVHQDTLLFKGSVRENLTLGSGGFTDAYLREQCERAQIWQSVDLKGGLDGEVQESGSNFSAGERQLLGIARVLVFNAPVLILDEATSNVDPWLERRFLHATKEAFRGRTSILIAHRLSTIRHCDSILVLDRGKIVEMGPEELLLSSGSGLYCRLLRLHQGAMTP